MDEYYTPDDLSPEQLEIRNFKKSALARRISEDVYNPRNTRDLLEQKKSQYKQLIREKDKLRTRVSETYFLETFKDPIHTIKMPMIRILPSKGKHEKEKLLQDSSVTDLRVILFPDISDVFWNKIETLG